jgi:superfamily II DNA/RNA helicase
MLTASRKDREATEKRNILRALIDAEGDKCTNAIIFCNRKMDVDTVAKSLKKHGYDAAPIHGDLDQSQRTKTLDRFRNGELRFLVASDVAARGLDVPSVSHVFNFDVPSHAEDYVHRIGRTGRAGRDGKAIMICVPRDEKNLADVERLVQREIPRLENPLGDKPAAKPVKDTAKDAPKVDKPEPKDATQDDAQTTEKPKRTRTRSRKKSDSAKVENESGATDTPKPEATPEVKAEKQPEPKAAAPEEKPQDDKQQQNRRGGRGSNRNDNRNQNNRNDNKVVGLGEHTPEFIGLSFAERRD